MYKKRAGKPNAHVDAIYSVDWTPYGDIITGSLDETVRIWNHTHTLGDDDSGGHGKDTLVEKKCFEGHELGVVSAKVHKDGKILAASSLDSHIRLYDMESGNLSQSLDAGPIESWSISFHPTEHYLATGGFEGKVNIWDCEKAQVTNTLTVDNGTFALSVQYAPSGNKLGVGCQSGTVAIFDTSAKEHGKVLQKYDDLKKSVRCVEFDKEGSLLFAACDDCNINMYDVRKAKPIATLTSHTAWVLSVASSPDGKHFASSSTDKTVKIWDIGLRKYIHSFENHSDQVWDIAYASDGRHLVSVGEDSALNLYEVL